MNIGERIRYFRMIKGWSQERLAQEANINTAFVGHLERGLKSPTVNTLEKVAAALNITLEELFTERLFLQQDREYKQFYIRKIENQLEHLSEAEVEKISEIILNIINFKNT